MELKLKTVSPVILSGRNSSALYRGVDYEKVSNDKTNIIYPFFSEENRNGKANKPFEKANSYYIPASSLKGSLLPNANENISKEEILFRRNVIFRDILIEKEKVALKKLWKFQYLYQENKNNDGSNKDPKYDIFFPTVGIEMLEAGICFTGTILIKDTEKDFKKQLEKRLNSIFYQTKEKLNRYSNEIDIRIDEIRNIRIDEIRKLKDTEKVIEKLEGMRKSINQLIKSDKKYIFLGGYKGLLGSLTKLENNENIKNGFYVDEETLLPYGLVEVII